MAAALRVLRAPTTCTCCCCCVVVGVYIRSRGVCVSLPARLCGVYRYDKRVLRTPPRPKSLAEASPEGGPGRKGGSSRPGTGVLTSSVNAYAVCRKATPVHSRIQVKPPKDTEDIDVYGIFVRGRAPLSHGAEPLKPLEERWRSGESGPERIRASTRPASGPQGRRREPGQGERPTSHHEERSRSTAGGE